MGVVVVRYGESPGICPFDDEELTIQQIFANYLATGKAMEILNYQTGGTENWLWIAEELSERERVAHDGEVRWVS